MGISPLPAPRHGGNVVWDQFFLFFSLLQEMGLGRIPAWSQFNLIPCPGEEFLKEFLKFKERWPRSRSRGKDGFGKSMGEEVIRG